MLKYEFEVKEPEKDLESVIAPQLMVAYTKNNLLKVTIYFMANEALEITGGLARSALGKTKLQ